METNDLLVVITTLAILCLAVDWHAAMVSPWRAPKTLVSINSLVDNWMDTKSTLARILSFVHLAYNVSWTVALRPCLILETWRMIGRGGFGSY